MSLLVDGATGAVALSLADAAGTSVSLATDSECTARLLQPGGQPHYLAATVDAGARILSLSVDGAVCDGSSESVFGFEWVPPAMGDLNKGALSSFVLGQGYGGQVLGGAWYGRFLFNSEVVGNWRAGPASA